ncbi:pyruvate ferredoxin oxidoreductase [Microbacterium testaceum StLB037]|uniref:Pyruvate ferredoxin oxidoreductase n=1 Tax=Microbacterium testaceum (strain StLB037) TaxID=979556 RepID=E8NDK2_MICTS|nr:pyruvate ferredoxin oxidoreductase [Microbacterium testaceum StLB037]
MEARVEHVELEVGDDDGDLDQLVDREVEARHLAVDPDEPVIRGGAYHPSSLVRGSDTEAVSPRHDSNV